MSFTPEKPAEHIHKIICNKRRIISLLSRKLQIEAVYRQVFWLVPCLSPSHH